MKLRGSGIKSNFKMLIFCISKIKNLRYLNKSFSQEGEDIIINNIFGDKKLFYVDIGALHPFRFSNTALLYLKGSKGINIDATPGSMKLFNKYRRRDINLEIAISDVPNGELDYYMFKEPAYNTFDKSRVENLLKNGQILVEKKKVTTRTIESILDEYVPNSISIDIMDVDIEGLDEKILNIINISKYRPKCILIECFNVKSEIVKILEDRGYKLHAFTGRTGIFTNNEM